MLDHVILLGDRHLDSLVREYKVYFNETRPHQGIGQRVPSGIRHQDLSKSIVIKPVLGGLHADYRRAA
jgi:putative transposase